MFVSWTLAKNKPEETDRSYPPMRKNFDSQEVNSDPQETHEKKSRTTGKF